VITVEALDGMTSPPVAVTYPDARFTLVVSGTGLVGGFPPYDVPFTPTFCRTLLECLFIHLRPTNCKTIFVNT
jgi:hypothetical protein